MLTLPIKRVWLNRIINGEKKEEYRSLTPYYDSRLSRYLGETIDIILRNGYSPSSLSVRVTVKVLIGLGHPGWGANDSERYYVLKIIKVFRTG